MTEQEWISQAKQNRDKLASLLSMFHPVTLHKTDMKITAKAAELACENVRQSIRHNFEGSPVKQFDEALAVNDINTVNRLLNEAWFGVPESTSCWSIEGFKEAVELMEDLPEE